MSSTWPSKEKIKEVLEIADKADAARPLPKDADAIDKLKHRLCREILIFKETNNLSHDQIGKKLGVGKTEVSKIINYHIERYTIDKLYRLTLKLMPDFEIAA